MNRRRRSSRERRGDFLSPREQTGGRNEIENPVTGERITFTKRAADTDGEVLEFELMLAPRDRAVPAHVHAKQEEHVRVVSGAVTLRLGGEEHRLNAGDERALPAGVPHTLWNDGKADAHLIMRVTPALRTETAIETIFGLARDGKTDKSGNPNPLQGSLLAREYETFLAFPPVAVQRIALAPLVPLARLLGYRATYPQYSPDA